MADVKLARSLAGGEMSMPALFFSYSHVDEALRDELEKHLAGLKRQGAITTWHDRKIPAGGHVDHTINEWLDRAEIVLFLVSPDFLASNYCYDVEVKRGVERHQAGEARCIPVILRPCDWHDAPFGRLNACPRDGKPVTSWPDRDAAFLDVAQAIRNAVRPAGGGTIQFVHPVQVVRYDPGKSAPPVARDNRRSDFAREALQEIKDVFEVELPKFLSKKAGYSVSISSGNWDGSLVIRAGGPGMAETVCRIEYRHDYLNSQHRLVLLWGDKPKSSEIDLAKEHPASSYLVIAELLECHLLLEGSITFVGILGKYASRKSPKDAALHFWDMFIAKATATSAQES